MYRPWYVTDDPRLGNWREFSPLHARLHGSGVVAKFEGLDDPESVQEIRGMKIGARRSAFAQLGEDEYYWVDLVGAVVKTETGVSLGQVVQVMETGANAVMRIKDLGKERMIPFANPIVKQVCLGKEIVVDWDPEWT